MFQEYTKQHDNNRIDMFYIWIIDNYCFLLNILKEKIYKIFTNKSNPFINNDYYILYGMNYLYNRNLIDNIPNEYKLIAKQKNKIVFPKNIYRL